MVSSYLIAYKKPCCAEAVDHCTVKRCLFSNLYCLLRTAFSVCHNNSEILRCADIAHSFMLEYGTGIWVRKHKFFCKSQRKFLYVFIFIRQMQKHIRIKVSLIAEYAVCTVAPIFKIGFILRKPCGIKTISPADQHDSKPVFRRHPNDPFVAVDQTVLPGWKFF